MSKGIKHVAPGQYLGFGLQPVRLCYHLLTGAPGDRVSLEHLDDVAVHRADGSILIEQTKSALTGNPLSDWSDDLWKTLANWVRALDSGQFDLAKTEYCLYVTPVKPKVGKLVAAMDKATNAQEVAKLIADLQGHLSKRSSPPACIAHVNAFLAADPVLRVQLLSHFSVANHDSDPVAPLKGLLRLPSMTLLQKRSCAPQSGTPRKRLMRYCARDSLRSCLAMRFSNGSAHMSDTTICPGICPLLGKRPQGT